MRHGQTEPLGQRAGLGLLHLSQREDEPVELLAPQAAEHVALVVGGPSLIERAALRAGVVPGGDGLRAETVGRFEQGAELHRRVAEDAGIGRLAAQIALTERRADLFLELRADVEDLERELEKGRRLHGVPPRVFVGVVEIEAADLPARAAQQRGGHGGIDAAGKTEHDLHLFFSS